MSFLPAVIWKQDSYFFSHPRASGAATFFQSFASWGAGKWSGALSWRAAKWAWPEIKARKMGGVEFSRLLSPETQSLHCAAIWTRAPALSLLSTRSQTTTGHQVDTADYNNKEPLRVIFRHHHKTRSSLNLESPSSTRLKIFDRPTSFAQDPQDWSRQHFKIDRVL